MYIHELSSAQSSRALRLFLRFTHNDHKKLRKPLFRRFKRYDAVIKKEPRKTRNQKIENDTLRSHRGLLSTIFEAKWRGTLLQLWSDDKLTLLGFTGI